MHPSRRAALIGAGSAAAFGLAARAFAAAPRSDGGPGPRFVDYPFALGVASGDPSPDGVVLWTRLSADPLAPAGFGRQDVEVEWLVGADAALRQPLHRGRTTALAARGHAVHVELRGLQPGRDYWYRFRVAGIDSPIGRAVTLPTPDDSPGSLKIAWASCQHYEQGYFSVYKDMIAGDPRLIFHLGDYIYESSWGPQIRRHPSNDPATLADYRAHHAVYKLDPDLQAAHAHTSWAFTWDDHDVSNDYAGDFPEDPGAAGEFVQRKAAAYQAYLENLPISRRSMATRMGVRLYQRLAFGNLAAFIVVDTRQFRSKRPCVDPKDWRSRVVSCAEIQDPAQTVLGDGQEYWLQWLIGDGTSQWTSLVQTTLFSRLDQKDAEGRYAANQGSWDAYPLARQRILDLVSARKARDVVVIGGDKHAFFAADVKADFGKAGSPVIASEFVATSITSISAAYERTLKAIAAGDNGHIRYFDDRRRGYARAEITPSAWTVDFRQADTVFSRTPAFSTQRRFVVAAGKAGVQEA